MKPSKRVKATLGVTLTGLFIALAGPASAETLERTYQAPFQKTETVDSSCSGLVCTSEASAELDGSLQAEAEVVNAGLAGGAYALAGVGVTHTLEEPASKVSIELRIHIDPAFAAAKGAPYARGQASVELEVDHSSCWCGFVTTAQPVATAEFPEEDVETGNLDVVVSIESAGNVPAGEVYITGYVVAHATLMNHHAPSSAAACADDCLGVGRAQARIGGTVESLTVKEVR